ncbi:MAG: OmpA family protein, partial [Deltaproteobacteria bacterium]|nr:OmpA family protein [Deltaproteobacteria bacterium]
VMEEALKPAATEEAAAAVREDSDGDGVYDDLDRCPDTLLGIKVDQDGCPLPVTEKVTVRLNVEFDTDKADIKSKYHDEIEKFADFMNRYTDTKAIIEGHTDSIASMSYNQALSERRADSVKQYLVEQFNIDPDRLTTAGYGETRPIGDNATAEGRQLNRRVQAVIETMVEK